MKRGKASAEMAAQESQDDGDGCRSLGITFDRCLLYPTASVGGVQSRLGTNHDIGKGAWFAGCSAVTCGNTNRYTGFVGSSLYVCSGISLSSTISENAQTPSLMQSRLCASHATCPPSSSFSLMRHRECLLLQMPTRKHRQHLCIVRHKVRNDTRHIITIVRRYIIIAESVPSAINLMAMHNGTVPVLRPVGVDVILSWSDTGLDVSAIDEKSAAVESSTETRHYSLVDGIVAFLDGEGAGVAAKDVARRRRGVNVVVTLACKHGFG